MEEIQYRPGNADAQGGLLDVLVILAENAKLLVVGSLLVGLTALGICFVIPQTYQSTAVLQADQSTAGLMLTAAVLDPVVASLGLARDMTPEEARTRLQERVRAVVGRTDKLLTLTVSARSPQQAQAIAAAVIQRTFQESRPKGTLRLRVEAQLAETRLRLKNAQEVGESLRQRLKSLSGPASANTTSNSEVARGYAELLGATGTAQSQVIVLETQLEGLSDAQVVQPPTLAEKPSQPKKALVAIAATLVAGLALLLFVLIRKTLQSALDHNANSVKWLRIRNAFGLR